MSGSSFARQDMPDSSGKTNENISSIIPFRDVKKSAGIPGNRRYNTAFSTIPGRPGSRVGFKQAAISLSLGLIAVRVEVKT